MKNQKGITLVALIITIIVMLILVAVTVSIVIQSGLLDTASRAASSYKNEVEKETDANYTVQELNNASVSDYNALNEAIDAYINGNGT